LFDKVINLVDELGSDSHEAVPNLILPILDGLGVHVVAPDCLRGKLFNPFKFIHMLFIRFVDVHQLFLGDEAFKADISIFFLRKENCSSLVTLAKHFDRGA